MEKKIKNKIRSQYLLVRLKDFCLTWGFIGFIFAILFIAAAIWRYPGKEGLAKDYERLVLQGESLSGKIVSLEGNEKYVSTWPNPPGPQRYFFATIEYTDKASAEKRIIVEDWENPLWWSNIREGDAVRLYYLPSNRHVRIASENNPGILEAKRTLGIEKK